MSQFSRLIRVFSVDDIRVGIETECYMIEVTMKDTRPLAQQMVDKGPTC